MRLLILMLCLLATPALALEPPPAPPAAQINQTLDAVHDAAARADADRYFGLYAKDAIYIGTDAAERWTIAQFRAYAEPYFAQGKGWTYRPRERHVTVTDDPCRCIAWFDELLDSDSYGTSRGTGVMVVQDGEWKVAQYALTFPMPNDLAKGFTDQIKAFEAKPKP
ncbi:MAG: nuclear transport factor 2 family protein [Caulobacter sp.]|nr:nuclear transport factor 2 family protein [Caulobacter sp.]